MHGHERGRRDVPTREGLEQRSQLLFGEVGCDVQHRHLQELVAAVPDLVARALVDVRESQRVGVEDQHTIAGRIQDLADLTRLGFGFKPFGDVAYDCHDPKTAVRTEGTQADLDREHTSVGFAPEQVQTRAHRSDARLCAIARAMCPMHLA